MTCKTQFDVTAGDDLPGIIEVKVTDEGVIVDLITFDGRNSEVVATWGATAQELADDYCH